MGSESLERLKDVMDKLEDCFPSLSFTETHSADVRDTLPYFSMERLESTTATLNAMKRALKTLDTCAKRLRHRIKELQINIRPVSYHYGLLNLPDEVLQTILLKTLPPPGPQPGSLPKMASDYKDLSLTCQRFRRILSSCSSIWSFASDRMSNAWLQYFLERRGTSNPLRIELLMHERASSQSKANIMSQLLPSIDHWSSLHVRPDYSLLDKITPINATSLRSLEVNCVYLTEDCTDEVTHLHRSWSFPNVENLRYHNVIPPPGFFTKLTRCELTMISSIRLHADLEMLTNFLVTTPLLQSLAVEFDGRLDFFPKYPPSVTVKVHLNSLTEFTFKSLGGRRSHVDLLPVFMASIAMPNVEHFTCSMPTQVMDIDQNWVYQLFPPHCQYSNVRHLRLCIPSSREGNAFPFEVIFARLPTIEGFDLDIPCFRIVMNRESFIKSDFSCLHSVTLRNLKEMLPSDIINAISCLREVEMELTTMRIVTSNHIDEEILSLYLPHTTRLIYESGLGWV